MKSRNDIQKENGKKIQKGGPLGRVLGSSGGSSGIGSDHPPSPDQNGRYLDNQSTSGESANGLCILRLKQCASTGNIIMMHIIFDIYPFLQRRFRKLMSYSRRSFITWKQPVTAGLGNEIRNFRPRSLSISHLDRAGVQTEDLINGQVIWDIRIRNDTILSSSSDCNSCICTQFFHSPIKPAGIFFHTLKQTWGYSVLNKFCLYWQTYHAWGLSTINCPSSKMIYDGDILLKSSLL